MFERFTDQARRVVVLAQEEAQELGHNYIGTEHILLGLLREDDGLARQALAALDVSLGAARQQVLEIIGPGAGAPSGHIPFTPRSKKVLELSLRESLRLGDDHIGTEHVLLGLVREGEGVGVQVLAALGATADRVLVQVLEIVKTPPLEAAVRRVPAGHVAGGRMPVEQLSGRIGEVLSRLEEISARLTAIEGALADLKKPPARSARKPPASGQPKPPPGASRKPPASA